MQIRSVSRKHFENVLAALLLLILAVELGFSARRQSQTFDEAFHIYAGYQHWCGDFGINPEHPPFAKLVAAIPLLFDRPKDRGPSCASYATSKFPDGFALARDFLYLNDAGRILAETRFFIASFTLLLAVFVFLAARRMFGGSAALLAMLLVVFEPTILGHGVLVTTDLAETCWFFAAVYACYRYTQQPTWLRLIACGLAAGLALAAKHSGILILPALALLGVADAWIRRRDLPRSGSHPLSDAAPADSSGYGAWTRQLVRQVGALALIVAVAITTLWAFYRFRHSPRPAGHEMSESLSAFIQASIQYRHAHSVMLSQVIPRLTHVLPESDVYGMADVATDSVVGRTSFILGRLYPTGRWFYFPVVFVIKCTIGFLLLLLLTFLAGEYLWREKTRETLFLLIPAVFFFGVSMTSHLNFGARHILPIFPLLIALAAGAACHLARQRRAWAYAVILLAAFHCVSSLRAFPNYLSSSNEAWGGPQQTYRYLLDTNSDWGQGLIDDREYLARDSITDCWMDYVGTADVDYYGIPCRLMAYFPNKRVAAIPRPFKGTLLVSVNELTGWQWGPPEFDPFGALRHVKPVANLGGHTLVDQGRFDLPLVSGESHSALAQILVSQGHVEEALVEARTGVEMAPQSMDTHLALAGALEQAKQLREARSEYLEAIRLAETQGEGYYWFSIAAARQGLAALDSSH
ncbi:MAG: glycosyltransferase family 39 protein [Candidatus Acidiferrales bacterium]